MKVKVKKNIYLDYSSIKSNFKVDIISKSMSSDSDNMCGMRVEIINIFSFAGTMVPIFVLVLKLFNYELPVEQYFSIKTQGLCVRHNIKLIMQHLFNYNFFYNQIF